MLLLLLLLVFMLHALFRDYTDSDGCCVTVVAAAAASFIVRNITQTNDIKLKIDWSCCFFVTAARILFHFSCFSCRRRTERQTKRWTALDFLHKTFMPVQMCVWRHMCVCVSMFDNISWHRWVYVMWISCIYRSSIEINIFDV